MTMRRRVLAALVLAGVVAVSSALAGGRTLFTKNKYLKR